MKQTPEAANKRAPYGKGFWSLVIWFFTYKTKQAIIIIAVLTIAGCLLLAKYNCNNKYFNFEKPSVDPAKVYQSVKGKKR